MIDKLKSQFVSNPLLKNYLKVFSVDVLAKAAGILLLPVYLKLMTQEEFGLYGYLIAIVTTFSLVLNLGVYVAQSKFYHEYPENRRGSILYTLNLLLLIFIVLIFAFAYIFDLDYPVIQFLFKNAIDYDAYRGAVWIGTIASVYSLMLVNYFLNSDSIRKLQLFNISRIVFVNAIVILAMFMIPGGDHALLRLKYSYLIEIIIISFFSFFYVRSMEFRFDKEIAFRTLKISMPIVISALLGLLINLSDRYFIEKFGTLKNMSIYNLGLTISGIVPFVFASFQNIWLPHFLKEKDLEINRLRSKRLVTRLLFFFLGLSLTAWAVLKTALLLGIIDMKYDSVMLLLPIVLLTSIITSLTTMFSNHLIYLEKLYLIIVVGVPVALLSVILNIKLVPLFNVYGAAASSLVTSSCYLIAYSQLSNIFYKRMLRKGAITVSDEQG